MRIKLSSIQFDKLADLSLGLGQLLFASTVIPYLIPALDKPSVAVLIFGILVAVGLWIFALWIVRRR